jgi:hypothetical protein
MDPALGVVVEEGGGHLAAAPAEGRLDRWGMSAGSKV